MSKQVVETGPDMTPGDEANEPAPMHGAAQFKMQKKHHAKTFAPVVPVDGKAGK